MSNIYEREFDVDYIYCSNCSEIMDYEQTLYKGTKNINMENETYHLFSDVYVCEYCGEELELSYLRNL